MDIYQIVMLYVHDEKLAYRKFIEGKKKRNLHFNAIYVTGQVFLHVIYFPGSQKSWDAG